MELDDLGEGGSKREASASDFHDLVHDEPIFDGDEVLNDAQTLIDPKK